MLRRDFLEAAALSGLGAGPALAQAVDKRRGMPTRILGKTGARVSILSFGAGNTGWTDRYKTEEPGVGALTGALDLGVSYIDTAARYGDGVSETWVGKAIAGRRKDVFLTTKVEPRKGDEALRVVEGSLKRLKVDQVDMIHIDSLNNEEDLAAIEAKDGVLAVLQKLKQEKVTRFIGITSHTRPTVLKTAIERHDFDCTQMALNAAQSGWGAPGMAGETFEKIVIPAARRKQMGILAMKVTGRNALTGKAPMEKLIRYVLSSPITAATIFDVHAGDHRGERAHRQGLRTAAAAGDGIAGAEPVGGAQGLAGRLSGRPRRRLRSPLAQIQATGAEVGDRLIESFAYLHARE
jgi:aryl-alcohol dehydrogenase-like predicted oxidoreductase